MASNPEHTRRAEAILFILNRSNVKMGKHKSFPKTRKFNGKTFEDPSFHKKKSDAAHVAKRFREHPGNQARVVKGKNILGEIRHVVYRKGRTASSIKRSIQRKRR